MTQRSSTGKSGFGRFGIFPTSFIAPWNLDAIIRVSWRKGSYDQLP